MTKLYKVREVSGTFLALADLYPYFNGNNPFGSVSIFRGSPVMLSAPDISCSFANLTHKYLILQLRSSMCCSVLQKHRSLWVEFRWGPKTPPIKVNSWETIVDKVSSNIVIRYLFGCC